MADAFSDVAEVVAGPFCTIGRHKRCSRKRKIGMGKGLQRAFDAAQRTQILPCPFCGSPPETQASGEGGRGLMIVCITPGCVNPHTSYYDHETAIRVWNSRPPR